MKSLPSAGRLGRLIEEGETVRSFAYLFVAHVGRFRKGRSDARRAI